ncbi:MAG: porin [Planctomycetes bacterium]|nr:porin [Planctomycetota bacterium]
MNRSLTAFGLITVAALFAPVDVARAQSERERELEDLVRQLSEQVQRLEQRMARLEGAAIPQATGRRIEPLERNIEKRKDDRPPARDSEEWSQLEKWISDSKTLRPYWKDGLRLDSIDGSVKLEIGGRIQHDYGYFAEDSGLERRLGDDFEDGTEFRRARLYFSGTIHDDLEFKAEYDFAGGDAEFKDVYLGFTKHPKFGNVRLGHFKEPFGLEALTSSNYITFLERSLAAFFAPLRNTGVMFHGTMNEERGSWAAGFFRQTDDFGDGQGGRDYNVTARLTALPVYEDKGRKLLHVGLAYTHQNYEDDMIRFRSRPEVNLSPRLVDTGAFSAEYGDLIGGEIAWVNGPLSLQAEYVHAFIEGRDSVIGDPRFWAASIQASYFLTGEHRAYQTSTGSFDRIRPLHNYGKDGGTGAWELAARLSYLNLNDRGVEGGRLRDLTLGVNWYLNPNVRTMWNYILADPSEGGDLNAFLWRLQVAF